MKKRPATANDWRTMPMPEAHDEFSFRRSFTPEQMELLRMGNVPEVMEDK